jgi:uncharacterized protein (UPF0297 family)
MENNKSLPIFEKNEIRRSYNEESETWYFSVVDIVKALTDSSNPTDYLKKNKKTRYRFRKLHRDKLSPSNDAN